MFSMRDIYPWYGYPETTERTIPIERKRKDLGTARVGMISPEDKHNVWFGVIVFVIILILLIIKL